MRRSLHVVAFLSIAALIALGCSKTITVDDVRAMLTKNVPDGTTKDQVVNFLNAHQFPNSACETQRDRCLLAKVPGNQSKLNVIRTDYGVTFWFDENEKLSRTTVEPHYTGP